MEIFNVGDIARYNGKECVVMDSEYDDVTDEEILYVCNPNDPDQYEIFPAGQCRKVPLNAATPRCIIASGIAKQVNELPWRK